MEHKPQNYYPVFEANQVLTNTHLNELRNYLDQQTRFSRKDLSGIGIVSGLTFFMANSPASPLWKSYVLVNEGVGITSEGFLIRYKGIYKGNPAADDPDEVLDTDFNVHTFNKYIAYQDYEDPSPDFYWWQGNEDNPQLPASGDVIQLVTEFERDQIDKNNDPDNPKPLPQYLPDLADPMFNNKVVVVYLEMEDQSLRSCISKDCDNKGLKRNFNLRVLLVKKELLLIFQNSLCSPHLKAVDMDGLLVRTSEPEPIEVGRFTEGVTGAIPAGYSARLASIDTYTEITAGYNNAFGAVANEIFTQLTSAYNAYGFFLGLKGYGIAELNVLLGATWKPNNTIQYSYDFLKELAKATNEFRALAWECHRDSFTDHYRFCRHLMLGLTEPAGAISSENYEQYRNYFLQGPLTEAQDLKLRKAQMCFTRILLMIKGFKGVFNTPATGLKGADATLKIIPSKEDEYPLGKAVIGDYYNNGSNVQVLYKYWDPERSLRGRAKHVLSFHSALYNNSPTLPRIDQPILYNQDETPFYRIQSVLGYDYKDVVRVLKNEINKHGLPFKVIALQLDATTVPPDIDFNCLFAAEQLDYIQLREELACVISNLNNFIQPNLAALNSLSETYQFGAAWPGTRITRFVLLQSSLQPVLLQIFSQESSTDASLNGLGTWYQAFDQLYREARELAAFFKSFAITRLALLNQKPFEVCALPEERKERDFLQSVLQSMNAFLANCAYAKMMALVRTFQHKLLQVQSGHLSIFRNFAERHPGMEHRGGVPAGGTFIVVYDRPSNDNVANRRVLADFALPYLCCDPCADAFINPLAKPMPVLPPVARIDFAETTPGHSVDIPVLHNDFDPLYGRLHGSAKIIIKDTLLLTPIGSSLGGSAQLIVEESGLNKHLIRYSANAGALTQPQMMLIDYEIQQSAVVGLANITVDPISKGKVFVTIAPEVKPYLQAFPDYATASTCDRVLVNVLANDCATPKVNGFNVQASLWLMNNGAKTKSVTKSAYTAEVATVAGKEIIYYYPKRDGVFVVPYRIQLDDGNFSDSTLTMTVLEGCCCCEDIILTVPCHIKQRLDILGDQFDGKGGVKFNLLQKERIGFDFLEFSEMIKIKLPVSGAYIPTRKELQEYNLVEKIDSTNYYAEIGGEGSIDFWSRRDFEGQVIIPYRVEFYDGKMMCEGFIKLNVVCDCCDCQEIRYVKNTGATVSFNDLLSPEEREKNFKLFFFDEEKDEVLFTHVLTVNGQTLSIFETARTPSWRTRLELMPTLGFSGMITVPMVKGIQENDFHFQYCRVNVNIIIDCPCPCLKKYSYFNDQSRIIDDLLTENDIRSKYQLRFKGTSGNPVTAIPLPPGAALLELGEGMLSFGISPAPKFVGTVEWDYFVVDPNQNPAVPVIISECKIQVSFRERIINPNFTFRDEFVLANFSPDFGKVFNDTKGFYAGLEEIINEVNVQNLLTSGGLDQQLADEYAATLDQIEAGYKLASTPEEKAAYAELYTKTVSTGLQILNNQPTTKATSPMLEVMEKGSQVIDGMVKDKALAGTSPSFTELKSLSISSGNTSLNTTFTKFPKL